MGRTSTARERLIATMADLVHQRGYAAVGVDEVCKAAGVKKGSFYYFFKSKRELMLAALDLRWQMLCDHILPGAFGRDLPPLQRLQRLFLTIADLEAANRTSRGVVLGCPFGNLAAELGLSEASIAKRTNEAFCGFASIMREALNEAKARGEVDRHLDVKEAAEAAVAYFEGLMLLAKTRNDPAIIRRLGPLVVHLARPPVRATRKKARGTSATPGTFGEPSAKGRR
jgi:TetR/AcrR family transcriptional repressor of nem operon